MKTIIKSTALVFALSLLSTGLFAANTIKTDTTITNEVTADISYADNVASVDVNIENASIGESTLLIYDLEGNLLLTDKFTNEQSDINKSYLLTDVTEGSFFIKVYTTAKVVVLKDIVLSTDIDKQ